jgi:AMIN domain-containing protein
MRLQLYKQMPRVSPLALVCLLSFCPGLRATAAPAQNGAAAPAVIQRIAVLGRGNDAAFEIRASRPVIAQTQVLSGPDRVIIDFPGAIPGTELHPLVVDRGEVTSVRVGLFAHNPPVTRIVLDLKTPQNYQLFPSGNTVLVKLGAGGVKSAGVLPAPSAPVSPPAASAGSNSFIGTVVSGNPQIRPMAAHPAVRKTGPEVTFQNGLLSVRTQKASLAQVLFEIHRLTGADIGVPAGAEREPVVADLGPAPPKEVLAALLNGSHYNFIIMGSDGDANVDRVILTPKSGGPAMEQVFSEDQGQAVITPSANQPPAGAAAAVRPIPQSMPPDQDSPPPEVQPQSD